MPTFLHGIGGVGREKRRSAAVGLPSRLTYADREGCFVLWYQHIGAVSVVLEREVKRRTGGGWHENILARKQGLV